jgi:hypothetical protein
MNGADLIKLAKVFDNFIELQSSRVRIQDIVAVKSTSDGILIVTPYGEFQDDMDFDSLNTRIKDTLEVIKENARGKVGVSPVLDGPTTSTPQLIMKDALAPKQEHPQTERKIIPMEPVNEPQQTTIAVGVQGAKGNLFSDDTLQITARENILVLDPTGQHVLATPAEGSAIRGEKVSGFIHTNGKYVLSFQEYPHTEAIIIYTTKRKAGL